MSNPNTRQARASREKTSKQTTDIQKNNESITSTVKIQPTAEQIRIAQIINGSKDTDDPELQNKMKQVMDITGKSSDEACVALHDCDNDPTRAINMLLEGKADQGEWETSIKKKKSRPIPAEPDAAAVTSNPANNNKENRARGERIGGGSAGREGGSGLRNRASAPPRMARGRGRESEKNERNLESSRERSAERRARPARFVNGSNGRPSRGGRGGTYGGTAGGGRFRSFQGRGGSHSDFPKSIDTWCNAAPDTAEESSEVPMRVGNWSDKDGFPATEDWDNEDWAGSLSETKVFTPSVLTSGNITSTADGSSSPSDMEGASLIIQQELLSSSLSNAVQMTSTSTSAAVNISSFTSSLDMANDGLSTSPTGAVLGTEFSVLSNSSPTLESSSHLQSSASAVAAAAAACAQPSSFCTSLGNNSSSSLVNSSNMPAIGGQQVNIPARPKSHRVRSVASSKIPSTAVQMPDDTIAALDVQFGSLEFCPETNSLGFSSVLAGATSISSVNSSSPSVANHISSIASNQSSLNSSVLHSMSTAGMNKAVSDVPVYDHTTPHVPYQSVATSLGIGTSSTVKDIMSTTSQPSMPEISDSSLSYVSQSERKINVPAHYSSQRPQQSSVLDGSMIASKGVDTSPLSAYAPSTNIGGVHGSYQSAYSSHKLPSSYGQNHHHHSSHASSIPQSTTSSSLYSSSPSFASGGGVPAQNINSASSAYGSVLKQQQSSYTNPVLPVISTYPSSSYGSQSQQPSAVLHTVSSGLSSTSVKDVSTLEVQSSTNHVYDMSHSTSTPSLTSTLTTPSSTGVSTLSGLSSGSLNSGNASGMAKSTMSANKTGLPNLQQSVPTVLGHQYIMSQAGLPFYSLQQPVYTYEDLQLLQQRIPQLASYYDMSFQPSTTLTSRDAGIANVAYTASNDVPGGGKFGRAENASPVPTTLAQSQQQQTSVQQQQAFISPTALAHSYGYYYPAGSVVTGGFAQYPGPIFPMQPASNAHGATTSTHFQKPNAYGSHAYASGYDSLGQNQDYSKTSYGSNTQNQTKGLGGGSSGGSVGSISGNDLSASVYSKTHSQMNKQPYEKPGFHAATHAGTPPPFQTGPLGAPSAYATAAPFIPMMQHHSPMLHHQLHQEAQAGSVSQRNASGQVTTAQIKAAGVGGKQPGVGGGYGGSYWPPN